MSRALHIKLRSSSTQIQLTSSIDLAEPRMILTSYSVKMKTYSGGTHHAFTELHVRCTEFFSGNGVHSTTSQGGGVNIPLNEGSEALIQFACNRVVETNRHIPASLLFTVLDNSGVVVTTDCIDYIHLHFSFEEQ